MSIENVKTTAPAAAPDSSKPSDDRTEIKRLAQQFEAMLMTQMLREMRRSMLDDDEEKEDGFGADTMTDTIDVELGAALSRAGGVGLAGSLLDAFERQIASLQGGTAPANATVAAGLAGDALNGIPSIGTESSPANPVALTDVTAASRVSSKFGWRQDPLTGEAKFHNGVDLAVAYGRDVKAAATGVVSFAGVQNGYGNTVVIDHEGGRQTRYAHLSQELVRTGDVVAEGQVVGKSGNSGRSTGPHLHFEMLVNGRPVDPVAAE
jgi:murein DD-endopeptidase MepM/ murein hydrolase activator NlpD